MRAKRTKFNGGRRNNARESAKIVGAIVLLALTAAWSVGAVIVASRGSGSATRCSSFSIIWSPGSAGRCLPEP